MSKCSLTIDGGAIAVKAPYDAGFVNELKTRVQPTERRWKPDTKQWVVSVRHGKTVQDAGCQRARISCVLGQG